jgi:hypothetical protein
MVKISGVQSQMASPQSTQHQLPKPPSITTKVSYTILCLYSM